MSEEKKEIKAGMLMPEKLRLSGLFIPVGAEQITAYKVEKCNREGDEFRLLFIGVEGRELSRILVPVDVLLQIGEGMTIVAHDYMMQKEEQHERNDVAAPGSVPSE